MNSEVFEAMYNNNNNIEAMYNNNIEVMYDNNNIEAMYNNIDYTTDHDYSDDDPPSDSDSDSDDDDEPIIATRDLVEERRLQDYNNNIARYRSFMDVWNYHEGRNFARFRSYPITTNFESLLHYLDEGKMIIECPRVYKIVIMDNIKIFKDYYNVRLNNPNDYQRTYYDDRYITYIKK